ncbi:hypothetical protein VTO42DRAFT_1033 [Malbranchea cinnamomea]
MEISPSVIQSHPLSNQSLVNIRCTLHDTMAPAPAQLSIHALLAASRPWPRIGPNDACDLKGLCPTCYRPLVVPPRGSWITSNQLPARPNLVPPPTAETEKVGLFTCSGA